MGEHESGVNYQNLIRDLAETYPFDVAEVVVTELVANSLDAGATRISIEFDPLEKVLIVADNGKGMNESDFDQYHDFAAGLKTRGTGIGFAGVGAKISFNIADSVITETLSKSFSGGSNWRFQSNKKLLWEDIDVRHLSDHGTRVEVRFRPDTDIPYSSTEDMRKLLQRHYFPLTDSKFLDLYNRMGYYSSSLRFVVNGQTVKPTNVVEEFGLSHMREFYPTKKGKRVGYGVLGLAPAEYPFSSDICGLLLCTRGKVIKADLFNQFPGDLGPRIFGAVEVPDFINFLTTNKIDFIRRGTLREFESFYDPIRQEFRAWLVELGIKPTEIASTDEVLRLERELRKVLDDIPELADFFGFPSRTTVLEPSNDGTIPAVVHEGKEPTFPAGEGTRGVGPGPAGPGDEPGEALVQGQESDTTRATPITRTRRRGPRITLVEVPGRNDLAWVDGNNVVINSGHPSYSKVRSNPTARTSHCLFAIGNAIQRFLAIGADTPDMMFVDRMMAAWGRK